MRQKTCWKPFTYSFIDRLAAQDRLDGLARQGWELTAVYLGVLARFHRTERRNLTYFLDWADPKKDEDPDYLQLCADAGWELRQALGAWNIYVSQPGVHPVPIQTDPELEYRRCRKKTVPRLVVSGTFFILLILLYLWILGWVRPGALWLTLSSSFSGSLLLFLAPLGLVLAAPPALRCGRRLWLWRREAAAGLPLSSPPQKAAQGFAKLNLLLNLLGCILLLGSVPDILLNGMGSWLNALTLLFVGIGFAAKDDKPGRNHLCDGLFLAALGGMMALCLMLRGPARTVFPGRVPDGPIRPGSAVSESAYDGSGRCDGPLGSQAQWSEESLDDSWYATVSVQVWATPALARQALGPVPPDLVPVPGEPGLWRKTLKGESALLVFRWDRAELSAYAYPGEEAAVIQAVRAWADPQW